MARKRIGELLVERGAISQAQLQAGLSAQLATRQRLGITLIEQGLISESQLAQVLADSLGLPTVDLSKVQVDWSAVHMLRARFCEQYELFPFGVEGKGTPTKRLVVALSDPLNEVALQEIEFTTGLKVAACVATHSQIREAVLRYYHKVAPGTAGPARTGQGGSVRLEPPPPEEEPLGVVMGQEIISATNPLPPAEPKAARTAISKDLEFLFGGTTEADDLEKLEKKFWALMRVLARKGLVSREEFMKELGQED